MNIPTDTIQCGIEQIGVFADWQASADALMHTIAEHPTKGKKEQLDLFDLSHLDSQATLVRAHNLETGLRTTLRTELANPDFEGLDIIGKLAILHALDIFQPLPKTPSVNKRAPSILSEINAFDTNREKEEMLDAMFGVRPTRLQGSARVLRRAEVIDANLRNINDRIHDGSHVRITEDLTWWEFRTLRRAGHRETFHATTLTFGRIENRTKSFPLKHPVIDGVGVNYNVPDSLEHVELHKVTGRNRRATNTTQRSSIHSRYDKVSEKWEFSAPLLALRKALAKSTDTYERNDTFSPDIARTTVRIGLRNLPNLPV